MNVGDVSATETSELIGSDKVEGTRVFDLSGEHIGSVERIMIEKRGGKVAYAVLSFGGFLGLGHEHYPLPWSKLTYDETLGGYRVDISREQLEGAPSYGRDEEFDWSRHSGQNVYDYYGVPPYWL